MSATFGPTTIAGITIRLASTSAAPDALSTTFASNLGANATVVFAGDLTLQSSAVDGPPRTFDIVIPLTSPFTFQASGGMNLVLDVTIPSCTTMTPFDNESNPADSVSRQYTDPSGSGSPTADFQDSQGLVTQFNFIGSSVPAMSPAWFTALALVLCTLGISMLARLERTSRADRRHKRPV